MRNLKHIIASLLISVATLATADNIKPKHQCLDSVALVFSPPFSLCLPLDFYRDAALVPSDSIALKFKDGSYFFSKIVTAGTEGFQDTFDMRSYPRILLGLANPPDDRDGRFRMLRGSVKEWAKNQKPESWKEGGKTFYLIKADGYAEAYIASDSRSEQILMMGFDHISDVTIQSILRGIK